MTLGRHGIFTMLVFLGCLSGCAHEPETPTTRLKKDVDAERDAVRVAELPPGDQAWYRDWRAAAVAGDATPAIRERLRLGFVWFADRNMSLRMSTAFPGLGVGKAVEQDAALLIARDPSDPAGWHARARHRMTVRGDVPGGREDACRAADIDGTVSAYQELCADALIAGGDRVQGPGRLLAAYRLTQERGDQCRIIDKVLSSAPDPDAALASASRLVLEYCERMNRDAGFRQWIESDRQRRQECVDACNKNKATMSQCLVQCA